MVMSTDPGDATVYVAASADSNSRVVVRLTSEGMAMLDVLDPALGASGEPEGWQMTIAAAECFAEALAWLFPPEPRRRARGAAKEAVSP